MTHCNRRGFDLEWLKDSTEVLRLHRFFVDDVKDARAVISGEDFNHARSLRLRRDEEVAAVWRNHAYSARVSEMSRSAITLELGDEIMSAPEPKLRVTLYQAMPKGSKLETIIQKCVELGVYDVCPILMERCVAEAGGSNKLARWRRIAKEAAMQSGRLIVPQVREPLGFEDAMELMKEHGALLVPYEEAREPGLKEALGAQIRRGCGDMGIVIGPEGGMTDFEAKALSDIGGMLASLGPRILRTETAGMCVIGCAMYEAGEMEWR